MMPCTIEQLANAKHFTPDYLTSLGLTDVDYCGQPPVKIPYLDHEGNVTSIRYRLNLHGDDRFRWQTGSTCQPYGRWMLEQLKADNPERANTLIVVEGESDSWTCWAAGYCCLGLPGATNINCLTLDDVAAFESIYVWQEPDEAGKEFPVRVKAHLEALGYSGLIKSIRHALRKDISEIRDSKINCRSDKSLDDFSGTRMELQTRLNTASEIVVTPQQHSAYSATTGDVNTLPRLLWDDVEAALLKQGKIIKQTGAGTYTAQCPAHNDGSPSLSITVQEDGRCLLNCFAGCGFDQIVSALHLDRQYEEAKALVVQQRDEAREAGFEAVREIQREAKHVAGETEPLSVTWFSDIERKTVEWFWTGYLPKGKLVCVYGPANEMKTTVSLDLAARITTGKPMPDGSAGTLGRVAILTSEDSAADTLLPRFVGAGGDPSRICKIDNMVRLGKEERFFNLALPELRTELENKLSRIPDLKLLFVDPISSYLAATDSHRVSDVRGILSPLSDMADRLGITVLYINHVNKCSGQSALHRASGSTALIDACRVAIFVGRHPDDPEGERRVLTVPKHNLTRKPQSMVFEPEDVEGSVRIKWTGCTDLSADDLLNKEEAKEAEEGHHGVDSFLRELLKDGAVEAGVGQKEALAQGYTKKQIRVARERLGVKPVKTKTSWLWSLPVDSVDKEKKGEE